MRRMTMPFGKHHGVPLDEVPKGYLRWLKENVPLRTSLARAVEAVLAGHPAPEEEEDDDTKANRIVRSWTPAEVREVLQ